MAFPSTSDTLRRRSRAGQLIERLLQVPGVVWVFGFLILQILAPRAGADSAGLRVPRRSAPEVATVSVLLTVGSSTLNTHGWNSANRGYH